MIPSMIEIDDKIVSTDILTVRFACDLSLCRGMCCVEGNGGAPLDEEELDILEREYENFRAYMTPGGIEAIEEQGFFVVDPDGDYATPLVDDADCAYAFTENGITLCAIEKAFRAGEASFRKPVSCHLYPIRVKRFGNGTYGLNYHRWSICSSALDCGEKSGRLMYRSLQEPIVRRFGREFYDALEEAAEYLEKNEQ